MKKKQEGWKNNNIRNNIAKDDLILTTIEQQHNILKNNGHLIVIAWKFESVKILKAPRTKRENR